jgi:hypothetical protein
MGVCVSSPCGSAAAYRHSSVELPHSAKATGDHEPSPGTELPPVEFIRGSEQRSDPLLGKKMITVSFPRCPRLQQHQFVL